jgi:alpha-tubulin suppressor-like RCC1 family protein
LIAVIGGAVALATASAAPAVAGTLVTPSSGPTTGGTAVSLAATTLRFTQIAEGENTGYGLAGDGRIYAWGDNGSNELGDGGTAASSTPVAVVQGAIPTGVTITQIAAGWQSGYALGSNGRVYSWGDNSSGQLGDGTTTPRNAPVALDVSGVAAGVTFTSIAAGAMDAYAIASDGTMYSWGYGHDGELGNGANSDDASPVVVATGARPVGVGFTRVAAGDGMVFGIGTNGRVYSWGGDVSGALGTGSVSDENVPTALAAGAIPAGVTISQVAAGQEGGYALGSDGNVYDWGSDLFGDLGDGHNTDQNVPVAVSAGEIPAGLTIVAIAAGSASGYAVGTDGHVYDWGIGGNGELGNGAGSDSNTPVLVTAGGVAADVELTRVTAGYHSATALGSDGRTYGWGDNTGGDLGDGSTAQRTSPVLGANAVITSVTFGGVAGTGLVDPPGVTTVVTPSHAAGVTSIVVAGSINGGSTTGVATSRTVPAAFTFTATLAPTGLLFPWWLLALGCAAIIAGAAMLARRRAPASRNRSLTFTL